MGGGVASTSDGSQLVGACVHAISTQVWWWWCCGDHVWSLGLSTTNWHHSHHSESWLLSPLLLVVILVVIYGQYPTPPKLSQRGGDPTSVGPDLDNISHWYPTVSLCLSLQVFPQLTTPPTDPTSHVDNISHWYTLIIPQHTTPPKWPWWQYHCLIDTFVSLSVSVSPGLPTAYYPTQVAMLTILTILLLDHSYPPSCLSWSDLSTAYYPTQQVMMTSLHSIIETLPRIFLSLSLLVSFHLSGHDDNISIHPWFNGSLIPSCLSCTYLTQNYWPQLTAPPNWPHVYHPPPATPYLSTTQWLSTFIDAIITAFIDHLTPKHPDHILVLLLLTKLHEV